MPYITREDGERFVIPSYRDTLSGKKEALLKREITLLSSNYGEYITLQKKNGNQYEAAFSNETGYLLGETVWHYFKRPSDLIYCEAIPNTSEAILVIVKGGTVYLDGSFPIDSIPEELVVFRTQQNRFDIYLYGDVPISKDPVPGKFALDASSVKSFNILTESVFAKLPRVRNFQLRLVDVALKAYGIGVFPVKPVLFLIVFLGLIWMGYTYVTTHKKEVPAVFIPITDPYASYRETLRSPDPANEIDKLTQEIGLLYTVPGWYPSSITYTNGVLSAQMLSPGSKTNILFSWASQNHATVQVLKEGLFVGLNFFVLRRPEPTTISDTDQIIAEMLDRLATVLPGNNEAIGNSSSKGRYRETEITINFDSINLDTLALLGEQLKGLPLVLTKVIATVQNGSFTGTITLKVLGN